MELYHLRTFVTVAEEGHLTRSAQRLCTSQPAVSAHIKALEEELGVSLFIRTPKGMQLTPEGELLKAQADKALDMIATLQLQAQNLRDEIAGTIRLGLNIDPLYLRITELFSFMAERYPRLEFHLLQHMSWEVPNVIRTGELDAGFFFGMNTHAEIAHVPLAEYRLRIVGPAPWRDKIAAADWARIAELPWVWTPLPCQYYQIVGHAFEQRGLKPFKVAVADMDTICKALATSGVGLAVMLEAEAREAVREGKLAIWERESFPVQLSFAYHEKRADDPRLRALREGIRIVWGTEE